MTSSVGLAGDENLIRNWPRARGRVMGSYTEWEQYARGRVVGS